MQIERLYRYEKDMLFESDSSDGLPALRLSENPV